MSEKKFYLTKKGLKKIREDYQKLKKIRRSRINSRDDVPGILHSEELNPDYVHFQEDLNLLDVRITELEYVIKNVKPISPVKGVVDVGTIVTVNIDNEDDKLTIVEALEANPEVGMISKESPVGKALLGGREGDEVTISSPVKVVYKIKKIDRLTS